MFLALNVFLLIFLSLQKKRKLSFWQCYLLQSIKDKHNMVTSLQWTDGILLVNSHILWYIVYRVKGSANHIICYYTTCIIYMYIYYTYIYIYILYIVTSQVSLPRPYKSISIGQFSSSNNCWVVQAPIGSHDTKIHLLGNPNNAFQSNSFQCESTASFIPVQRSWINS